MSTEASKKIPLTFCNQISLIIFVSVELLKIYSKFNLAKLNVPSKNKVRSFFLLEKSIIRPQSYPLVSSSLLFPMLSNQDSVSEETLSSIVA